MNAKLGYILAAAAVAAVAGAFFLGWLSGTSSGGSEAAGTAPTRARNAAPAAGTTAAGTATQTQWKTAATYGSWQVRCREPAPKEGAACSAVLQIAEKASGRVLFAWAVADMGKNGLMSVFETPTGVQIQSGLDVKVGDAPVRHVAFAACLPRRCTGQLQMDEALIKQMSAGVKSSVTIVAANGRGIEFGMSTVGFDKALAAISK